MTNQYSDAINAAKKIACRLGLGPLEAETLRDTLVAAADDGINLQTAAFAWLDDHRESEGPLLVEFERAFGVAIADCLPGGR